MLCHGLIHNQDSWFGLLGFLRIFKDEHTSCLNCRVGFFGGKH
jgi:hypothetical protein